MSWTKGLGRREGMFLTEPVDASWCVLSGVWGCHKSGWRGQQGEVPEARWLGTVVALVRSGCGVGWRGKTGAGGSDAGHCGNLGQGQSQQERRGWIKTGYVRFGD